MRNWTREILLSVAGFEGSTSGDVTTLGRGGSDTSAVALAAWRSMQIFARSIRMWTAFILPIPAWCPNAKKLPEITFADMLELASQSAQVLHNCSVELREKYHVNMEVVSSLKIYPAQKVKGGNKIGKDEYRRRCQDG